MGDVQGYVSTIFGNLLQPIVDLLGVMDDRGPQGPNQVQASSDENGYAASIALLSAVVVESAVNRTRYIRSEARRDRPANTLRDLGAVDLADDVDEIFAVRDAIAHNHLWEIAFRWDDPAGMKLLSAMKLHGYGRGQFERLVDPCTRQTRRLRLDVVPTRVHRATAVIIVKKCSEVLRFLEEKDLRYVGPGRNVRLCGRVIPFSEWASGL